MDSYCQRQELEFSTIAFLMDGHPIAGTQTAEEVFPVFFSSNFDSSFCVVMFVNLGVILSWGWKMEMKLMP